MERIGARVKRERVMFGWDQADLAAETGISLVAIREIEADRRLPTAIEASRLASAFQITVEKLVGIPSQRRGNADLRKPEVREAMDWFEQCIDNSLFVRRLTEIYEPKD